MNTNLTLHPFRICLVLPSYNNAGTLAQVIDSLLCHTTDIVVVNDGSTDATLQILEKYRGCISIVSYPRNRGKGYALKLGFEKALSLGFEYALTLDTDGQHKAESIAAFIAELTRFPDALIVGSRLLGQENMPQKNTFANKFSNFWFNVQTGIDFPDTQSGYRLYPLRKIQEMHLVTSRYETELEILVKAAWNGITLRAIPIDVYYAPRDERISHFRPFHDFARISVLNTAFVFGAIFYGYPKMLYRRMMK